jgi:hypothetical protein
MTTRKHLHAELAEHCTLIADLFKPGAKVTLLVRNPQLADGDVLVSDDDMNLVIEAIRKLEGKKETALKPEDVIAHRLGI